MLCNICENVCVTSPIFSVYLAYVYIGMRDSGRADGLSTTLHCFIFKLLHRYLWDKLKLFRGCLPLCFRSKWKTIRYSRCRSTHILCVLMRLYARLTARTSRSATVKKVHYFASRRSIHTKKLRHELAWRMNMFHCCCNGIRNVLY